jgi:PAS domain-containing protein
LWNSAAERVFGWTAEEMIGQPVLKIITEYLQHEEAEILVGIAAFFIAALGALCPHEFVYVPSLLSIIVPAEWLREQLTATDSAAKHDPPSI